LSGVIFNFLLLVRETRCLVRLFEVVLDRGPNFFLPECDELLQVKRGRCNLRNHRVVTCLSRVLGGKCFSSVRCEGLFVILDEAVRKLGSFYQVLRKLALDHLVLHLLQD